MSRIGSVTSILIGGLAILLGAQSPTEAAVVQPCNTAAAATISVLPIKGGSQTYCQSAYGWSDTWFATSQPATYDQHLDVLSGDDAPTLLYKTATTTIGSGNRYNAISPFLDAGTLNATNIGSNWRVGTDIAVPGGGPVGTSTIFLGATQATGLVAAITTTVAANGMKEAFTFTNNTGTTITHILFDDYFNFHANGSLSGDIGCPTTSFSTTTHTATTVGSSASGCSAIVSSGSMFGAAGTSTTPATPLAFDVGTATNVLAAMATATTNQNNANPFSGFNNSTAPVTGDGAVDVVWDLGSLANNTSTSFTIYKNFVPRTPEPASLALLATGLVGFGLVRRRRNQV